MGVSTPIIIHERDNFHERPYKEAGNRFWGLQHLLAFGITGYAKKKELMEFKHWRCHRPGKGSVLQRA